MFRRESLLALAAAIVLMSPVSARGENAAPAAAPELGAKRVEAFDSEAFGGSESITCGRVSHSVGQRVEVPSGTFDDAMVFEEFDEEKSGGFQLECYADGKGNVKVRWRGTGEAQKTQELTKVVTLTPAELDELRAAAFDSEKRGSICCKTPPTVRSPSAE